MQALFDIGEPTIPDLIEVIRKGKSESLAYENAFEVLKSFFLREDVEQGVRFFREKASESLVEDEKQRLNTAADRMMEVVQRLKKFDEPKTRKEKP
jgi:hypothetical protein